MSDIFNQLKMRLKLIFSDNNTIALFSIVILISFFITGTLTKSSEEKSSMPVGAVDLDNSNISNKVMKNVQTNPSMYVYTGTFEELKKKLNEQMIEVIFVIEKGFEENIKKGEIKGLVSVWFLNNDKANTVLADIFAGEMMYDICLYKTYNLYKNLDHDKQMLDHKAFFEYADSLYNSEEYKFSFDMKVINFSNDKSVGDAMDNSIIFKQIVISMLAIMISFVIMFAVNSIVIEKETELYKRNKITLVNKGIKILGNYFAVLIIGIILSLLYFIIILRGISLGNMEVALRLLGVFLLYSIIMSFLFYLIGSLTNTIIKFQFIGSAVVIIFGVTGFLMQVLDKFHLGFFEILKLLPNCWFIREFTDIIINIKF